MKTIGPIETCGDCPFARIGETPHGCVPPNIAANDYCVHPRAFPKFNQHDRTVHIFKPPPEWCPLPDVTAFVKDTEVEGLTLPECPRCKVLMSFVMLNGIHRGAYWCKRCGGLMTAFGDEYTFHQRDPI